MSDAPDPPAPGRGLARSPGALAGLRVIDLTRVLGGPYCTMILADHGAEVIKIEPPQGDETRDWGPPFRAEDGARGDASYFLGVNRSKRGMALDLALPEGRSVLLRLLERADVLVENFKPGTMERWGLGYEEALAPRFPGLVHCRVSGFGAEGPLGGLPGYDAILQAMTGLMSINGEPDRGPLRMATPIVDLATGLYAAIGILMALQERAGSGRGQFVDMTLHDCGLALLHPQGANYLLDGRRPRPLGNPHPNIAPYEKFATASGDIFLCIGNDGQFRRLCAELDRPELADDPRFRSNGDRVRNRAALGAELQVALATRDGKALADRLLRLGLPAGPVLAIDEALAAPHTAARDMLVAIDGYRAVGTPIKLSRTPGGARQVPPDFAEDSAAVLAEQGFSEAEIAALREVGALPTVRRR
ncbi:MAG TPA: CaiB/BaiF CoA-transferase family protein [Acetobacteraceae bacterium]|nr:CaiB/BaiF CoA-transferase family protein [Acetobacteraceae bacterium]